MNILVISDIESEALWDDYEPGKLDDIDLILSCGDLDPQYLSFLVTFSRGPVFYVHGNHDVQYEETPPEGCDCVEDRVLEYEGVRILGLGGSHDYNGKPHQYTQKEMKKRLRKTWFSRWRHDGVDILLTHAPAWQLGDGEDNAHQGFHAFRDFMDKKQPRYLIHGHVHPDPTNKHPRVMEYQNTKIINGYGTYLFCYETGEEVPAKET